MTTYNFSDDSYWFSSGCDCCEGTFMEAYNCEHTDSMLGTAHSVEDCYIQAIITEEGALNIPFDEARELWNMELDALKVLASAYGIEVIIEFDEDY